MHHVALVIYMQRWNMLAIMNMSIQCQTMKIVKDSGSQVVCASTTHGAHDIVFMPRRVPAIAGLSLVSAASPTTALECLEAVCAQTAHLFLGSIKFSQQHSILMPQVLGLFLQA